MLGSCCPLTFCAVQLCVCVSVCVCVCLSRGIRQRVFKLKKKKEKKLIDNLKRKKVVQNRDRHDVDEMEKKRAKRRDKCTEKEVT